ncbi:YbaB/EbfC family nucleoid-associated protein [Arthrobacter sp. NEB 688]|uniref:YbaB/EbfC family nucleoid-associated protein n=1 Tax=Arthrobacter sp. NEB 688 TaxID=904039 RepID=UPI001564CFFE|nr:YbaB/EbfC family nucleoid-associated protein [Arthrobacter sp. NEB 688]QKE83152.1 hypothetical protein HL663_03730 [Arthrobacter sp. NEB 688]
MTRSAMRLDRTLTFVVGLLLLAGGVALGLWWAGVLAPSADTLAVPAAGSWAAASWWTWLVAVVGVVLVLAGLSWLSAHLKRVGIRAISLPGSGEDGRLRLRLGALADVVAASAETRLATESASGSVGSGTDAGLVEVTVTARHDASLTELRRDLAAVDAEVATATGGAVPVRYLVKVHRPPRNAATT